MSATPVREGRHVCLLPSGHTHGAVVQCDDCGRLWRYSDYCTFGPSWVRMSRARTWWFHHRNKTAAPDPHRCGNCDTPFVADKEWCQNLDCVICPDHGGVRSSGRNTCFDCLDGRPAR